MKEVEDPKGYVCMYMYITTDMIIIASRRVDLSDLLLYNVYSSICNDSPEIRFIVNQEDICGTNSCRHGKRRLSQGRRLNFGIIIIYTVRIDRNWSISKRQFHISFYLSLGNSKSYK